MKNILKLTLMVLLVISLTIPLTGDAQGYTNKTYDPIVVDYLDDIVFKPTTSTVKTIGNQTITINTQSIKTSNNIYSLIQDTIVDGTNFPTQNFSVTVNSDDSYRLVNDSLNIDEIFTDKKPNKTKRGSGHSSLSKASISLHDTEYGTPDTLQLSDKYSGCLTLNKAKFVANVRTNLVDVSWDANLVYLHACIVPLTFDSGVVTDGVTTHSFGSSPNYTDRRSSHAFANTMMGLTTWYSLSATFYYN